MSERKPRIVVTGSGKNTEEASNIIATSIRLMVPELRASVRESVSNLRPGGLPPPGKTTQGFRGSHRSSSRESAKPQSFRTVRKFWRRLEGAPDTEQRPKIPIKHQLPERPKTSGWKLPVLRKTPNARESAMRSSQRQSVKKTLSREEVKKPSLRKEESIKLPIGKASSKTVSIEKYPSGKRSIEREPHKKSSIERVPSKKTAIEKVPSKETSIKRVPFKKMSILRVPSKESSIKKVSSKKTLIERGLSKKTSIERVPFGTTSIERESSNKPSIERVSSKKTSIEREAKKLSTEREQSKKASIEREPSKKTSIEREAKKLSTEREQSKKASIEREPSKKNSIEREAKKLSTEREQSKKASIEREPSTKTSIEREAKKLSTEREQSKKASIEREPSKKSSIRRVPVIKLTTEKDQAKKSSTLPPPDIDFERESASQLSRQRPTISTPSLKSSLKSSSSIPSGKVEELEERADKAGKRGEVDEAEDGEEGDEGEEADKGDEEDEENEEESEDDEEMEEEEEEEEVEEAQEEVEGAQEEVEGAQEEVEGAQEEVEGAQEEVEEEQEEDRSNIVNEAPHPPTADLRPSSLWKNLPRMFSDESLDRPSVILPVLLEEEKLFHELVAGGQVSAVSDFLSKRPKFNINCENYQGTSAIHIAVKEDNEDMVQYLLSLPGIEVRDSHLFAIRNNLPGILVMILDKLQTINPALEFMACSNSPEFAENITPLILAAEAGHFDIVGLLISRGHVIPRPHKPRCFCKEECQAIMKSQDLLSISSGKLHIYRALSNPAYICQTSPDPLLVAFKLSKELLTCGHVDSIYLRQYEALAESLRIFAVDIIAECRTLEEVETILSESKETKLKGVWKYPRLILAMDFKQKEFIAHPNVQQVLERTWVGDWIEWRGYRVYVKALYVFPRLLTLPLVLAVLMFTPTSKWAKHFSLPVNKLLSNVASYCIFLMLVFVQSNVNKKNQTRDTKPTGVEIFLVIYVITFLYNSIRSLLRQGYHRFFKFMWNIYELVMEFFFIMAFIFLIVAEIKTTIKGDKDLERKYWYYLDPELISESFFVLAAVMAFMRILLIFQISYHLGPLQVSLGKMTNDCAMFSVIFAIIILAYTAGMCRFYSYYEDMVQTNPETGDVESSQVNSFTSVLDTFKTLFWGLFGMSSFDVADVIIENVDNSNSSTTTNEHHLTEAVGYFAFATYMILVVIVILNMLIATMSNTFQKVTDNLDMEWLFGRTEVYMSYIDLPVLPPPFNIIPTTHAIVSLVKGQKYKGRRRLTGVDVEKGIIEDKDNITNDDYYVLMSQLVQRYFSTKNSENE